MAYPTPPQKPVYPKKTSGKRKAPPARPVYTYNADVQPKTQKTQARPIVYDYDKMTQQDQGIDVPNFEHRNPPKAAPNIPNIPNVPQEGGQAPRRERTVPPAGTQVNARSVRQMHAADEFFESPVRGPQRPKPEMYDHQKQSTPAKENAPSKRRSIKEKREKRAAARRKKAQTPGQAHRRRVRRAVMAGVLAVILLTAGIVISAAVLFKIKTITVQSDGEPLIYENNQIEAVFGHPAGENLFGFRTKETQQAIEQALPYLEKVRIKRRLPDEIVITASPAMETTAVASSAGGWAVLSENGKVLRIAEEPPEGLRRIDGAQAQSPTPGQNVQFTEPEKLQALQEILTQAQQCGLGPIVQADLTDMMEISILYQNRIRIVLGTSNDMEYKIKWAWKMVTPEQTENSLGAEDRGTLDVSSRGADGLGRARWRAGVL